MFSAIVTAVAIRVAEPIQVMLEGAIVLLQQREGLRLIGPFEPAIRVTLSQGPAHQLQAFVDHHAITCHQHRHRALG